MFRFWTSMWHTPDSLVAQLNGNHEDQVKAASTIAYLTENHRENTTHFGTEGVINALLNVLKNGNPDGQEKAAFAIYSLAWHGRHVFCSRLIDEVRDALIYVINYGNPESQRWAVFAIEALTYNLDFRGRFGTIGMRDALIEMLNTDNPDSQRWAAKAINVLTHNNQYNQARFGTDNMRDALIKMLNTDNPGSQRWAAEAIDVLTHNNQDNQARFGTKKMSDALVKRLKTGDQLGLMDAARSITNLVENPNNRKHFGIDEIRYALVRVLSGKQSLERYKSTFKLAQDLIVQPPSETDSPFGQGETKTFQSSGETKSSDDSHNIQQAINQAINSLPSHILSEIQSDYNLPIAHAVPILPGFNGNLPVAQSITSAQESRPVRRTDQIWSNQVGETKSTVSDNNRHEEETDLCLSCFPQ